jgi:hypothetical protein
LRPHFPFRGPAVPPLLFAGKPPPATRPIKGHERAFKAVSMLLKAVSVLLKVVRVIVRASSML